MRTSPRILSLSISVLLSAACFTPARAQVTWDGETDANWSTLTNWLGDLEPTLTDNVIFPSPVPGTGSSVTLGTGEEALSLSFLDSYTLTGGSLALGAATSVNVDPTFTATIASAIGGAGTSLTKTGAGTLVLSGTNTYTGRTIIAGGVLSISADANLGTAPGAATLGQLTFQGGTLQITAAMALASNRGILVAENTANRIEGPVGATVTYGGLFALPQANASLTFASSGAGATTFTLTGSSSGGGTPTAGSKYIIATQTTVNLGNNSSSGNLAGNVVPIEVQAGGILRFNRSGSTNYTGVISGAGQVNIANNSNHVVDFLSPTGNTYSGGTNMGGSNATIRAASNTAFGTGSINFGSGAGTVASTGSTARTLANDFLVSGTQGTVTLGQTSGGTGALTLNGVISLDRLGSAQTRTFNTNVPVTFGGVIQDSGTGTANNIAFAGNATRTLTAQNTFTGNISIGNGAVVVAGPNGALLGDNQVTVGDGNGSDETLTFGAITDVVGTVGGLNRLNDAATLVLNSNNDLVFNGPAAGSTGFTEAFSVLSVTGGRGRMTVNAAADASQTVSIGTLNRAAGTTLVVRGDGLGGTGTGSSTVLVTNGLPAVGSGGGVGAQNASVVPFILADASSAGEGSTFAAYDSVNGVRPLANGEYVSSIATAVADQNVSVAGGETVSVAATVNALRLQGGTTTLNQAVTVRSGGVILSGGANVAGTGVLDFGAAEGVIHAVSGGVNTISARIMGSNGLTIGAGAVNPVVEFSGSNTFSGTVAVGPTVTLRLSSAEAFNRANAPTVSLENSSTLQIGSNTTVVRNLTGASSSQVQNGIGGAGTLIALNSADSTLSGGINNGTTGTLSLTKRGASVLTLNNNTSNFSGAAAIERGGVYLSSTARWTGVSSIEIGGGATLRLTNGGSSNQGDRLPSAPITMRGGNFDFDHAGSNGTNFSESIGALTIAGGSNTIYTDRAGSSNTSTLTIASLNRTGGAAFFRSQSNSAETTTLGADARSRVVFTTEPTLNDGLIGGWAYHSLTDFATYNATGVTSVKVATYDSNTAETAWTTATNLRQTTAGPIALTGSRTVNSLNLSEGVGIEVGAGQRLTVDTGGIIHQATTNGAANAISGGELTAGTAAGAEVIVRVPNNAGAATIASSIVDNAGGSVGVFRNGNGTLVLSGTNTYTGATTMSGGTTVISSDSNLGQAPGSFTTGHLKLQGATLSVTGTGGVTLDANRGIEISAGSSTIAVASGQTLTYNGQITSHAQSDLTVSGAATLGTAATPLLVNIGGALALQGPANAVLGGSNPTVGTGLTLGTTAGSTSSLVYDVPGGAFSVGLNTAGTDDLNVGYRSANTALATPTTATLDLRGSGNFTAAVANFRMGLGGMGDSPTIGRVYLPAEANISAVTGVFMSNSGEVGQTGLSQQSLLSFGAGTSTLTTPLLEISGRKGNALVAVAAGGTLNLRGFALRQTDLMLAMNDTSTGTTSVGVLDVAAAGSKLVGSFDQVTIGAKSGGGTGGADGTISLGSGAHEVTANGVTIGSIEGGAANGSGIGEGTLSVGGGSFAVQNDVAVASFAGDGQAARGALNISGGTFSVGGNLTKTDSSRSSSLVELSGGTLDLTGGTVSASRLIYSGGTLANAASVTLDGVQVSSGNTQSRFADALIVRDVNIAAPVILTSPTADTGGIRYDAAGAGAGATLAAVNLGSVNRTINVGDSVGATVDLAITGSISGTADLLKTGAGALVLAGQNSFSGQTTVSAGSLTVAAGSTLGDGNVSVLTTAISLTISTGVTNAIADSATLSLAGGGTAGVADFGFVFLGSGVAETVGGLTLGGIAQEFGTYGATGSGADFVNDDYFAGSGVLVVVPEPGVATALLTGLAMLGTLRRRRR